MTLSLALRRILVSPKTILLLLLVGMPAWVHAATISGTIKDSSGAVIPGAQIEISGGDLTQPVSLSSDGLGKFTSPDLKPGKYSVRVTHEGFEALVKEIDLGQSAELDLALTIAHAEVNISVSENALAFANSDSVYRQLRNDGLGETFQVENFNLVIDVGTIDFHKGTLTFLNPVNGIVTGVIFIGEAHFNLKPVLELDIHELKRRMGADEVNEDLPKLFSASAANYALIFYAGLRTE